MGARGPKSTVSLTVVAGKFREIRRPEPPAELSDEQSVEWRTVVDRLEPDHFPAETHAMLAQYCRHVVSARRVSQIIASLEKDPEFDSNAYFKALKAADVEGRAMSNMATRLRFTQLSVVPHGRAHVPRQEKKPWD